MIKVNQQLACASQGMRPKIALSLWHHTTNGSTAIVGIIFIGRHLYIRGMYLYALYWVVVVRCGVDRLGFELATRLELGLVGSTRIGFSLLFSATRMDKPMSIKEKRLVGRHASHVNVHFSFLCRFIVVFSLVLGKKLCSLPTNQIQFWFGSIQFNSTIEPTLNHTITQRNEGDRSIIEHSIYILPCLIRLAIVSDDRVKKKVRVREPERDRHIECEGSEWVRWASINYRTCSQNVYLSTYVRVIRPSSSPFSFCVCLYCVDGSRKKSRSGEKLPLSQRRGDERWSEKPKSRLRSNDSTTHTQSNGAFENMLSLGI